MIGKFEDLKGKILTKIAGGIGEDEMMFVTLDGYTCCLYHEDD